MTESRSIQEGLGQHEPEQSIWPFIVSMAVLLSMIGFITAFSWNLPLFGLILGGTGVTGIIVGLFGWVSEVSMKKSEGSLSTLAVIIFILSEAALFGGLFSSYLYNSLPAPEWPPRDTPSSVPPLGLALILTVILLSSSVTMQLSEINLERRNLRGFKSYLALTALLGSLFIGSQIHEWSKLISEGFTPMSNAYGTFFFTITGLHGSHVLVGVVLQVFILILAMRGVLTENKVIVRSCGYYWHFVDGIWLIVLLLIYVLPSRGF